MSIFKQAIALTAITSMVSCGRAIWGKNSILRFNWPSEAFFQINRKTWRLRPYTEQRIQLSPFRFRIPDVCAVSTNQPFRGVLTEPPVLCVEVLSPEDRLYRVVTRAQEYLRMGVLHIWIVDPKTRECWTITASGAALPMLEDAFTIPGTPVRVAIADIFEEIDAAPKA